MLWLSLSKPLYSPSCTPVSENWHVRLPIQHSGALFPSRVTSPKINTSIILFLLSCFLLSIYRQRSVCYLEVSDNMPDHHPLQLQTPNYILVPYYSSAFSYQLLSIPFKTPSGNVTGRNGENNRNTTPIISHLCQSLLWLFYVFSVFSVNTGHN